MKRLLLAITAVSAIILTSCDPKALEGILSGTGTTTGTAKPLSNEEVIQGLKEALSIGARNAVAFTGKVDGFQKNQLIRIPFPPEAIKVREKAIQLGMQTKVDQFEANLNRAAEKASAEATDILVNAVLNMSIQDGFNILKGDSVAATNFLKNATTAELKQKFSPIVQKAIDEVKLTSYWEPLANAYNTAILITGGQQINPDLNAYVTDKALQGLFFYVAQEEKKIRKDPVARVTEILKRVFGSLDKP